MPGMQCPKIDIAVEAGDWPPKAALRRLAERALAAAAGELGAAALPDPPPPGGREISLLFTNDAAMQRLNAAWRGKDKPTNVLSFPVAPSAQPSPLPPSPSGLRRASPANRQELRPLGDIALAAETVRREAELADKPLEAHIAHLIIHGFLHLLGYDHEEEGQAEEMEALERAALSRMGIADPYATAFAT